MDRILAQTYPDATCELDFANPFELLVVPLSLIFILGSCANRGTKLCDNVFLHEGELRLGRNENVMVCGSSKGGEAWRDVPLPQAE